jgi:hypothetical protein
MIDTQSSTWTEIRSRLELWLTEAREQNDDAELDAFETATLRGRISALKDLLKLPERLERQAAVREASVGVYIQPTFTDARDY